MTAKVSEPVCCGEPMVHNSWAGHFECADAYFALTDDGVLVDDSLRIEWALLSDHQRERYEHWLAARVVEEDSQ